MKFSHVNRIGAQLALTSLVLAATTAGAATTETVTQAASGVVAKESPKVTTGKVIPKVTTATGAVTGVAGGNQYPAGTIPTPPKPKKDGPAVAGSIAVKGGDNQYPAGTIPTPPKPSRYRPDDPDFLGGHPWPHRPPPGDGARRRVVPRGARGAPRRADDRGAADRHPAAIQTTLNRTPSDHTP